MRHPEHPTHEHERRLDRLEDAARTLAALRRALRQRGRADVEAFCDALLRRLAAAPIAPDDQDEIAAVIGLLRQRVKFGLHERLRTLLLPLVEAIEKQFELCET